VQTLTAAGQSGFYPQVAVDSTGDAVFTWASGRVQARARAANGTLSAIQNLSPTGQSATSPQVAVDSTGDAVFAWQRTLDTDIRIQGRARAANGTLSPVQNVSAARAELPQVGIDSTGNAVFAWRRYDDAGYPRIQSKARTADGTLSPVQTLSPASRYAYDPQIAVGSTGDAAVAWQLSPPGLIQASFGP
jgi:hypothetical protein